MKVCPRCGVTKDVREFYKSSRTPDGLRCYCKVCGSKDSTAWGQANPDKLRVNSARSYTKNRDAVAQKVKDRRAAQPELFAEYRRRARAKGGDFFNAQRRARRAADPVGAKQEAATYRAANRDKTRYWLAKYRAAKLKATPSWADTSAIENFYGWAAVLTAVTGEPFEVDHVVPLCGKIGRTQVVSGLHVDYNLQILVAVENRVKSNIQWPDSPVFVE